MPVDVDKIKDALDAFAKDDYITAKDIIKKEIAVAKDGYIKDKLGLENEISEPEKSEHDTD